MGWPAMTVEIVDTASDMTKLAASANPVKRAQAAEMMADLCARGAAAAPETRAVIGPLLTNLAQGVERAVRLRLAARLAEAPWAPHDLVMQLALDDIDVASEVIARSTQLVSDDLMKIVSAGDEGHRTVLAGRPALDTQVSDAIAERREAGPVAALLKNETIALSDAAMSSCVDAAEEHVDLCALLAERPELTDPLASEVFLIAGEALREAIAERYDIEPRALLAVIAGVEQETRAEMARQRREDAGAAALVEQLASSDRLSVAMLVRAVREERVAVAEHTLTRLLDVPMAEWRKALANGGAWALALALAATGIELALMDEIQDAFARAGRCPKDVTPDERRRIAATRAGMAPDQALSTLRRLASQA